MTRLGSFLRQYSKVIHVVLTRVRGSSPRDVGAEMFVAVDDVFGTIGGGQLEYLALGLARKMLAQGVLIKARDIPLGPEIGQCCGGRVELLLTRMSKTDKLQATERAERDTMAQRHVYVLGAGHVGRALADLLQHLPVRTVLIDQRADELKLCKADVEMRLSALPEHDIASAPTGSAFIVLTHDHALDFLLASEALARGDAEYVGLIGSVTKRLKFKNWCKSQCEGVSIDTLTCPIGASGSRDKRPQVIAAAVVAEVIARMTSETADKSPERGTEPQYVDPISSC